MTTVVSKGPWDINGTYSPNDLATFAGEDWVCIQATSSGQGTVPSEFPAFWSPFGRNTTYRKAGDWDYNKTYSPGAIVSDYQGNCYQALSTTTQDPDIAPTSPAPAPVTWTSGHTPWHPGDLVIGSNDNLYNCSQGGPGGSASNPVSGTGWTGAWTGSFCASGSWKGYWSSGTTYHTGDTVYYADATVYTALQTTTGVVPWSDTSGMIWSASFGITLPPLPSAWEAATVPAWISGTHYHNGDFVKSYEPLSVPSSPPVFNVVAGKVYSPNSFVTHGGSVYYQSAAQGTPSGTFSGSAWVLCAPTAHWKGLWSSTATYNVDDVVVVVADPAPDPNIDPDITSPVAGKIWKATAPVTGTAPSNTGWTQLPSSGVNIRANAAFYWTATVEIPGVHDDNPPASSNDWWSNTYPVPFYYG